MSIPKSEFFRITKGNKPRYQLYQPGFNNYNGCWLDGAWITLPKEEWDKKKNTHQKLYAKVSALAEDQHHRDKGVALKNMTPAQRQAWNYFSGKSTYDCMCNGHFVCAGVNMAGSHISPTSLEWLRKEGYKIIDKISRFKKETNQIKGLDLPEDIIHRTEKPVDTVRMTIDQNKARSAGIFEVCLKGGSTGVSHPFMTELAVHHLIQLEEQIIRAEWEKTKKSPDPYDDHERDTNEYIQARAECKKVLGLEFQKYYEESRASHNSCAEANLKNSDRHLFCWVLPKFNDDGTHEPWTEEMTPRNDYEPLKAMMKK